MNVFVTLKKTTHKLLWIDHLCIYSNLPISSTSWGDKFYIYYFYTDKDGDSWFHWYKELPGETLPVWVGIFSATQKSWELPRALRA